MVIIEHLSKWLKLVPLLNHNNGRIAYAFLDGVFNKFNTLAKILTNQGTKFHGEFQKLCEKANINHHMISWHHLKINELAKQMAQMVKWGLCKYRFPKGHIRYWDLQLPWLAVGYKFSEQASLASFSPYFLLFDHELKLLVSIQCNVMVIIDLDAPNV